MGRESKPEGNKTFNLTGEEVRVFTSPRTAAVKQERKGGEGDNRWSLHRLGDSCDRSVEG